MVTIKQLQDRIRKQEEKLAKQRQAVSLQLEKSDLSRKLKKLKRSPSTIKNIEALRRTGIGLKKFAVIGGRALIKQAKLIKEQQLREDALFAKGQRNLSKRAKKVGKKLRKASKKRSRRTR